MAVEEIPQIVRTAVTLLPELANIPGLGKIIIALNKVPTNDTQALEQLQSEFDKKKKEREKTQTQNARYVIKVSEAMKCVDKSFDNANLVWAFVKSIGSLVSGGSTTLTDPMRQAIYQCLEENRLRQDTPRVFSHTFRYHRPSKGHGKGRGKF